MAPPGKEPEDRQSPARQRRRAAFIFGLRAETTAVIFLRLKGYSILAQRYLGAGGEIDIIAARRSVIAFVEVKARPSIDQAMMAITPEKSRRMSRAARHWLARNPRAAGKTWRGDAVFLAPWRIPSHSPGFITLEIS